MAENIEIIRPINLPEAQQLSENDVFVLDSETGGVRKIPKNKVYTPVDDTLSESGEAADAKVTGEKIDELKGETALIQNPVGNKSGELVSFSDGADMPAISVIAHIEPVQSGTGTPSPDNVRQISGWESVSVTDSGKNLVNYSDPQNQAAYIDFEGILHTSNGWLTSELIKIDSSKPYVLSGLTSPPNTSVDNFRTYDADGNYIGVVNKNISAYPITFNANVAYVQFCWSMANNSTVMFEQGTTATAYEPYTGNTNEINLGQTVYGGTLDVVSGELTVDRAIIDGSNLTFTYTGWDDNPVYYSNYIADKTCSADKTGISEVYEILDYHNNEFQYTRFYIRDTTAGGDASVVNSRASGHKFVYYLQNPQTYTLTPTEVETLVGENHIWADSGDVGITYRKDINIVIDELTNAIVSLGANV